MIKNYKTDVGLLLVTFLAASGWLFSKLAVGGMPPLGYLGFRFLGATLILLPFSVRYLRKLNRQQFLTSCMVGVYMTLAMTVWITAVNTSERLGEGAFITSLALIMVPFLARFLYGKPIDRFILYALPVAIAGIALLALKEGWQLEVSQLFFLISTVFLALHLVYTSEKTRDIPAMAVTIIQMFVAGLVSLVLSLFFESWPDTITQETWVWIVCAILFATSFRYLLLTWALKNSDAGRSAIILNVEPVWTAAMSVFFFAEEMSVQKAVGCALILMALLISRWRSVFPEKSKVQVMTTR